MKGKVIRMKTILCYGDSNTYGYEPGTGNRWPEEVRWTGRLQKLLGSDYRVVEEGCNGRTTDLKEPGEEWKSGLEYLKPCLNSHKPVDVVVMMLGTNDLKKIFHRSAEEIAAGAERLVQEILDFAAAKQTFCPKVILLAPPEIGAEISSRSFGTDFDETAITRSKEFPMWYQKAAERKGCIFLDAAKYAKPSKEDALHLMPEEHAHLAEAVAACIRENGI